MRIKTYRRIVQVLSFIVIIFGGYLIANLFGIEPEVIPRGTEGQQNLYDYTLPVRSCRYIEPTPTLLESCTIKYFFNLPLYRPTWNVLGVNLIIILILYFVFARFFCGWICPLGFISDIITYISEKLGIKEKKFKKKSIEFFKLFRYSFILFLLFFSIAIIIPTAYGVYMDKNFDSLACQVCPARTILPLFMGTMPVMPTFLTVTTGIFSTISLIFLLIFLLGSFYTRFWCRICPNGSVTSLFNKGSMIIKEKDTQKCTKCGVCIRVCPFKNTHVYEEKNKKIVNDNNCIMCFNCVDQCPEDDCLNVKFFGKKIFKSKFTSKKPKNVKKKKKK